MKKRKRGVILILIGAGIILLTYIFAFFAGSTIRYGYSSWRFMDFFGLEVPISYPLAAGAVVILFGVGMIILSFFPEEKKLKDKEDLS